MKFRKFAVGAASLLLALQTAVPVWAEEELQGEAVIAAAAGEDEETEEEKKKREEEARRAEEEARAAEEAAKAEEEQPEEDTPEEEIPEEEDPEEESEENLEDEKSEEEPEEEPEEEEVKEEAAPETEVGTDQAEEKQDQKTEDKTSAPAVVQEAEKAAETETAEKSEEQPAVERTANPYYGCVKVLDKANDYRVVIGSLGEISLLPDFENRQAWLGSSSPYNYPGLWGQCTWFAWGRFYEIYGFDPGFRGNGCDCVGQLVAAHPDLFEQSDVPAAGAVFSADAAHNHVGIVLAVDEETGDVLIQEGNFDGVSNPIWKDAIQDWQTRLLTMEQLKLSYGNVVFANPILDDKDPDSNADKFKEQAAKLAETDISYLELYTFADDQN